MKDIVSLRNHLFDQLNRLAEAEGEDLEKEVNRAASIVQVSEAVIKTAEVENTFIAITKSLGSGFVPVVNTGRPKSLIKQIEDAAVSGTDKTQDEEFYDDTQDPMFPKEKKGGRK